MPLRRAGGIRQGEAARVEGRLIVSARGPEAATGLEEELR